MKSNGKAVRAEWNGFPEVVVHSSIFHLPEYYAAKFGDHKVSTRIVKPLNQNGTYDG
jgi:hypothetical protein